MKTRLFVSLVAAVCLNGCVTQKVLQPTGGSRSDGTIELSYELAELEKPVIDQAQALKTAKERCRAWGYKNAEAFGGSRWSCEQPGGLSGCAMKLVTVKYQCLGNLK